MFDLTTLNSSSLDAALNNATSKAMENAGNPMLLYKSKLQDAGWLLGIESTSVSGQTIVLLSASITKGWVAFDEETNKKLGETAVSIWSNERPRNDDLVNLPNAKVSAQTSALVMIEGLNLQAEMKGSTVGMESAFNALIPKIVARLKSGERQWVNPRLRLSTDSYSHKKRGIIWIPVLEFLGWCDAKGRVDTRALAEDIV